MHDAAGVHLQSEVAFGPAGIVLELGALDPVDVDDDVPAVGGDRHLGPRIGLVEFLLGLANVPFIIRYRKNILAESQ